MSIIVLSALVFAGASAFGSYLNSGRPTKKRVQNDINSIRASLKTEAKSLAPWTKEEIELFSLNSTKKMKRRGWSPNFSGHFTNIYHEKVLLYHLKKYGAQGRAAVLIARNSKNEYIYNVSKKGVEIYIDEYYLGFLNQKGELVNQKSNKILGTLDRSGNTSREIIKIEDRIVGSVLKSDGDNKLKQRAFEMVSLKNEMEQNVFLALGYFNLIIREIR